MDNSQQAARRYWMQIERLRNAYLPRVRRYFKQALIKQIEPVMAELNKYTTPESVIDRVDKLVKDEPVRKAMERSYTEVGVAFAKRSYNYVKSGHPDMIVKEDEPKIPPVAPLVPAVSTAPNITPIQVDQWTEQMLEYVNSDLVGKRISTISKTTKKRTQGILSRIFQESVDEGLGVSETSIRMRRGLSEEWNNISKINADRIARTELGSASNRASIMGVKSTDIDMMKFWISTPDNLTRQGEFDHVTPGQMRETVGINDMFVMTGQPMQYPIDLVNGSPGNTINCRCTLAYIRREVYNEEQNN